MQLRDYCSDLPLATFITEPYFVRKRVWHDIHWCDNLKSVDSTFQLRRNGCWKVVKCLIVSISYITSLLKSLRSRSNRWKSRQMGDSISYLYRFSTPFVLKVKQVLCSQFVRLSDKLDCNLRSQLNWCLRVLVWSGHTSVPTRDFTWNYWWNLN